MLRRVVAALDLAGVPYIDGLVRERGIRGAAGNSRHDIVITPKLGTLVQLLEQFPESDYYVSREAALDAYSRGALFNVVDFETVG